MSNFRKVTAIINPAAQSGRLAALIPEVRTVLESEFPNVDVLLSREKGHASRLISSLDEDTDLVIAAGGDGTVHDLGTGLLALGSQIPMGILPLGSGNDFVRALKISSDWKRAVEQISSGQVRTVDSGKATWTDDAQPNECLFINALGVGFDAYSASIAPDFKDWPFSSGYTVSVLSALRSWVSAGATIWNEENGREVLFSGRLMFVTVGNAHDSGGGYTVNPGALVTDGKLDPCIVEDMSFWRAVSLLPRARTGSHIDMDEVTYVRTSSLFIDTDRGLPVHADGEIVSMQARSIRVSVRPSSLRVVVPRGLKGAI